MVCQLSQHKWSINPDFGWSNPDFGERTRAPPYANLSPKWLLKPPIYFWNPFMSDHFCWFPLFLLVKSTFLLGKPILWRQLVWVCRWAMQGHSRSGAEASDAAADVQRSCTGDPCHDVAAQDPRSGIHATESRLVNVVSPINSPKININCVRETIPKKKYIGFPTLMEKIEGMQYTKTIHNYDIIVQQPTIFGT